MSCEKRKSGVKVLVKKVHTKKEKKKYGQGVKGTSPKK